MAEKNFDYDDVSDSLIVSRKREGETIQGSAEVGDLILDFTSDGKIVNAEFQNISKFLEMMNVNPNILNELTDVDLIVQKQRGAISIFFILKTPTLTQSLPLAIVPVKDQLISSI